MHIANLTTKILALGALASLGLAVQANPMDREVGAGFQEIKGVLTIPSRSGFSSARAITPVNTPD